MIVLDSGALVALERNDRTMWIRLKAAGAGEVPLLVPQAALAQAWRGGSRQARLATALRSMEPASFDEIARRAGELCRQARTDDVVDASVALVAARPGATHVYTSDPEDLRHLLATLHLKRQIIRC